MSKPVQTNPEETCTDHWLNRENPIAAYQGNPLIEALGPIPTRAQVIGLLKQRPSYNVAERTLPAHLRPHAAFALRRLFVPTAAHVSVVEEVGLLLRQSYAHRNPLSLTYRKQANADRVLLQQGALLPERYVHVPQLGTSATGTAGTGKTLGFDYALSSYPQVQEHRYLVGNQRLAFKQVAYVKLNLFQDASLKALGIEFFEKLGEAVDEPLRHAWQVDRCNRNNIQPQIYLACRDYNVGMIVVDELQYMEAMGEGYRAVLRYFTRMMNCLGVAVAVIGTETARTLMKQDLSASRRFIGSIPGFRPFEQGAMWEAFLNEVWRYQYVAQTEPLKQLAPIMHELSGGVPDLVIKLYLLAQMRLFGRKKEVLTRDVLNETADQLFYQVKDRILELKGRRPETTGITGLVQKTEKAFHEIAVQESARVGGNSPAGTESNPAVVDIKLPPAGSISRKMADAGDRTDAKQMLRQLGVLEGPS